MPDPGWIGGLRPEPSNGPTTGYGCGWRYELESWRWEKDFTTPRWRRRLKFERRKVECRPTGIGPGHRTTARWAAPLDTVITKRPAPSIGGGGQGHIGLRGTADLARSDKGESPTSPMASRSSIGPGAPRRIAGEGHILTRRSPRTPTSTSSAAKQISKTALGFPGHTCCWAAGTGRPPAARHTCNPRRLCHMGAMLQRGPEGVPRGWKPGASILVLRGNASHPGTPSRADSGRPGRLHPQTPTEDWGPTPPPGLDCCLTVGRQVRYCRSASHSDTLNESGRL